MQNLDHWCDAWQLNLSVAKCSALLLGEHKFVPSIGQTLLPTCADTIRDLGIIITPNLSWSAHVVVIARKALNSVNLLFRAFQTRDWAILTRAFTVYVRPILEYATPV